MSKKLEVSSTTYSSGIGLSGFLTVLFVGLKLTGCITWSWGWVLAPLWVSLVLVIMVVWILLFLYILGVIVSAIRS